MGTCSGFHDSEHHGRIQLKCAKTLVFSHILAIRILREPQLSSRLARMARHAGLNLVEIHAPLGQAYDLCDPDRNTGVLL